MSEPTDKKLYLEIKRRIIRKNPVHSAYRSGAIVKLYKKEFAKKYPSRKPYKGKKDNKHGLSRWFAEQWESDTGNKIYTSLYSIFRPKKKVTKKTPKTFNELTKYNLLKAKRQKYLYGRVKRF